MRYSGSRLACGSCHLGIGTEAGTLTLLQTTQHYPRFSGRVGAQTEIEDRINECMQRSMNGKPLPADSPEMMAMAAYIRSLGARYAAMGATQKKVGRASGVRNPRPCGERRRRGAGVQGSLRHLSRRRWIGAAGDGRSRRGLCVSAALGARQLQRRRRHAPRADRRPIKARMPLGEATLTDDQAFDVAAFINAQPRPAMPNLERDYPDRATKPVDNAYGPFADPFPSSSIASARSSRLRRTTKRLKQEVVDADRRSAIAHSWPACPGDWCRESRPFAGTPSSGTSS